jgi:hypothetical protein
MSPPITPRPSAACVMGTLIVGTLIVLPVSARVASSDPFDVFRPAVLLQPADRQALDRSTAVIVVPPADGRDLVVFSAIALGASGEKDRALEWLRHIDRLRQNPVVLGGGRFSPVLDAADVEAMMLDRGDLEDIKQCRPGRCDVKLTRAEIEELRAVVDASGNAWRGAVQRRFREIALRRVSTYVAGGHAALANLVDHRVPRSPAAAFARLATHPPLLDRRVSDALARIAECPAAFLGPQRGFLYWSNERLGNKTVTAVTHVAFIEPDTGSPLEAVVIAVQVFATHYFDASLAITAIVRDPGTAQRYLVHLYRSELDILDGFWGGLARSVIAGRLKSDGPSVLKSVRHRLTNVAPPSELGSTVGSSR